MAKTTLKIRNLNQTYIRPSEGAGTTTLTVEDSRRQSFNLSAGRTVILPTTSIQAGDEYRIALRTTQVLTIQSSSTAEITRLQSAGYVTIMALVDAPTLATDWLVANGSEILTSTHTSSGANNTTADTYVDAAPTLALPPGDWEISSYIPIYVNNATGTALTQAGILTYAAIRDGANTVLRRSMGHFANAGLNPIMSNISVTVSVKVITTTSYKISYGWTNNSGINTVGTCQEYSIGSDTVITARRR